MKNLSAYFKLASCFVICFTNNFSSYSQEFAPIGTRWVYTAEQSAFLAYFPYTIEVVGEQDINGKKCKKLILNNKWEAFIYQDSLKVYAYSDWKLSNQFYLLYDFEAKVGDTIRMDNISKETENRLGSCLIQIDSVKMEIICGQLRKAWYYSPVMKMDTFYLWEMGRKYVEGVGDFKYLFPQYGLASPHIGDLRCFQDSQNDCRFVNYACDSIIYIVDTKNHTKEKRYVFPNPVKDELILEGSFEFQNLGYDILDIFGKIVLSGVYANSIKTSLLKQGLYFLKIRSEKESDSCIKFRKF